jgi:translocation and assembly module TamB
VDLFLRGNLNLNIRSAGTAPAVVGGEVLLHDSLLFQDIGNLVAIDLNQPAKRPPFFSVPQQPFAAWRLDVRVRGQKFLRVMSPVFKGQVSSGLQLGGTLKEPVALGEVSIETGQILFPFGTLDVNRGAVRLTSQNPYRPQVDFRGQGLNFGYNISLDVTGNVDAPNIAFNSVPPLTTREIMLMLTAGEIPSGDYSYTDMDKASKLGYYLGKELVNQVLGLDAGDDKLLFRTGEYVTEDGQLTYRVEYKLINWLSVFGEYTRFRDYNGGLKFNIYSR